MPGEGHEKGGVEGEGGQFRRNYLVPVPSVRHLEEFEPAAGGGFFVPPMRGTNTWRMSRNTTAKMIRNQTIWPPHHCGSNCGRPTLAAGAEVDAAIATGERP